MEGADKGSFSVSANGSQNGDGRPRSPLCESRRQSHSFNGQTTSAAKVTLNVITGGLGSGILSLPWSTAGATLVPALVIIAVVLVMNAWTIAILVRAAERFQTFDLGGVLAQLPGPRRATILQAISNIIVWISMFLCLVGYLVVIGDSAQRAVQDVNRHLVVTLGALLVLPLCFLNQDKLALSSSLTVGVNVYIFILLGVLLGQEAAHEKVETPCFFNMGRGTIAMVTAMMTSVIIQMCVLPMYEELENRTPQKFDKVIVVAFSVLFLLFAAFSVAGQTLYGLDVSSNILKDLPRNAGGFVAQCGTVIAMAGVYPIMLLPMVAPIRNSRYKSTVTPVTIGIVLASLGVAWFCEDLGFLNVINGALTVGVFVGLVPAVVGISLLGMSKLWLGLLCFVCAATSILGFIYTDNYAYDNVGGKCLWYGF